MNLQTLRRHVLNSGSAIAILSAAGALALSSSALAQDSTNGQGADAEGTQVRAVIITAERSKAAETAPTKASIDETQPEAIITHKFIEQATKENGSWVSVATIAPSMSGVAANGGGVGETTKLTMRGFQDGFFNLTYDGIAFGDTNGPTHHEASYWPASTIGAVVIDRGPGAAGDLGPANFGGAIHFFSPEVSDTFGASQKFTYGSFNTIQAVTSLNTGAISQLGGGKLFLNFEERSSNGELSNSSGTAQNQLAKFVLPLNSNWNLTLFTSHNYTRFYQNDGTGAGETWQQVETYGKNFALSNVPGDEHYYKYNQQSKGTDFEYADIKGAVTPDFNVEDQLYTYFYQNRTLSASSNTDLVEPAAGYNSSSLIAASAANRLPGQTASDLEGYNKLNMYRVWGDVVRLNKDFSLGTLKVGGLYEWSTTDRDNLLIDLSTNPVTPDLKFSPSKYPIPALTNAKLQENSDWHDYQVFADFYFRPTDSLTLTPGIKYVHEHLDVRAADENTAGGSKNQPLYASNGTGSPLYFFTANYKLTPYWSIYGQAATSFLFPDITTLYYATAGAGLSSIQSQKTTTYQTGSVYSRGHFTADFDVYRIDATNLVGTCGSGVNTSDCNLGSAQFRGVEGEAAYAFDSGLTVFANGGSNTAKQLVSAINPTAQELANAPRYTYAFGGVFSHGPWGASVDYKRSGPFATYGYNDTRISPPGYDTINASTSYDFGNFKVKLAGFNLADKRAITTYKPTSDATGLYQLDGHSGATDLSYYEFQAGREIQVTLQAKF